MSSIDDAASIEYDNSSDIAIIGMAGRFPGANDLDAFWENLCNGVESVARLSDEELRAAGVAPALINDPNYVKAAAILDDIESFDAGFFGYSPREADLMDPQQRLFLECAWQALEDAGYNPHSYEGMVGVFGGAKTSTYLFNLFANQHIAQSLDITEIGIGNDLANLTTRISYKLNLKGPSYAIHTACSTSLVAIHLACQSLLIDECQMAIAGGVAVNVPHKAGYLYQHGGIMSPDGHCRPFSADANGTLFGSGAGAVILKRLQDALDDGDNIYAVIKGSATNNDGALKASFTAPGVEGQTEVVAEALANAMVRPGAISYVETHGTATSLGDAIEMMALTRAFRAANQKQYCAIGSVKSNIGHLDTAAGISSFIKTVLALKHKQIPPTINFDGPNPKIDWANSPFYVNTTLTEWETRGEPRRAGVSSFGFGSTNAHVVLEEAPQLAPSDPAQPWQILTLSARSVTALDAANANLVEHLRRNPDLNLADVAYTLQVGRQDFTHRYMVVCRDLDDAVSALRDPQRLLTSMQESNDRPVVFMFSGQGAQYPNMARELYETEPVFRNEVDHCAELLIEHLGFDLRDVMYADSADAAAKLEQTSVAQPALFVIEYALAQLWLSWGVQPQALIGHSIGEYVAATLAGVMALEDALTLVATRGRLMQSLPQGAMLAIFTSEQEARTYLNDQLSLAAANGPRHCVVSGETVAIDALEQHLSAQGIETRRLHTSHAFHSAMMEPILARFRAAVERVALQAPELPYISNLTGTWISAEQATDPSYWVRHLRQPVLFSVGVQELLKEPDRIFLEVGPGQTLSTFVRQHAERSASQEVLTSVRHPQDQQSDLLFARMALGKLWLAGVEIDWASVYAHEQRRRVPLPTYPFERQRFWIQADSAPQGLNLNQAMPSEKAELRDWFYLPSWKRSLLPRSAQGTNAKHWLVFADQHGLGATLAQRLQQGERRVIQVVAGPEFRALDATTFSINPQRVEDYTALLNELGRREITPERILHCWSITPNEHARSWNVHFEQSQTLGVYSLIFLTQALGNLSLSDDVQIDVISNQLHNITGAELFTPDKATILGACKVIPQEYARLRCRSTDVVLPDGNVQQAVALLDQLLAEVQATSDDAVVAYRGSHRWAQSFEPVQLEPAEQNTRLREQGVYLITGGLGGVGLVIAEYLARTIRARLVLVGRSSLPERAGWDQWLATHEAEDGTSRKIRSLLALEESGAEVLPIRADVTDLTQMRAVVAQAQARFGTIHGLIHAAGVAGGGLIQLKTLDAAEAVLAPKTHGTLVLDTLAQELQPDFLALFSSLTAVVGEFGQVDYCAANSFLDAFAQWNNARGGVFTVSINWDTWQSIGMAVDTAIPEELRQIREQVLTGGLAADEGAEAFNRILAQSDAPQVLVSTHDLPSRIVNIQALTQKLLAEALGASMPSGPAHPRPNLQTLFVAPRNEFEQNLAKVWQQVLGIEEVGIHDDFFQLGGHSLLITQLLNRLHTIYPIDIPIRSLFENPTVAGMARLVEERYHEQVSAQNKPLVEQIREASKEERPDLLDIYVRRKIAQALTMPEEQMPADGSLVSLDIESITSDLLWNVHQDYHLQMFPNEVRRMRTVREMAEHISGELQRLWYGPQDIDDPTESVYDSYESSVLPRRADYPFSKPERKNPPAIFVHTSPRSGSTLFRVMLAGHPQLFSPPEMDILRCQGMSDWMRGLRDATHGYGFSWATQGLQWTLTELLGLDADATKAYMEEMAERDVPIQEVYAEIQRRAAPRILVDKSPQYSLRLDTLKRAEELFESPKYVHLVRHPYSVIESLVRVRFYTFFGPVIYGRDDVDPYVVAEKVWVMCNQNMLDFFNSIDRSRYYFLRYEDLVNDPHIKMREVCDFLDLPFDEAVIQPYDHRKERMISGIGDPNILRHTSIEARMAETWRDIQLPRRLSKQAQQLAAQLNYELPAERAKPEPPAMPPVAALNNPDQLSDLLQSVQNMSDEEVKALLGQLEGTNSLSTTPQ